MNLAVVCLEFGRSRMEPLHTPLLTLILYQVDFTSRKRPRSRGCDPDATRSALCGEDADPRFRGGVVTGGRRLPGAMKQSALQFRPAALVVASPSAPATQASSGSASVSPQVAGQMMKTWNTVSDHCHSIPAAHCAHGTVAGRHWWSLPRVAGLNCSEDVTACNR